jgi:YfiH family protein
MRPDKKYLSLKGLSRIPWLVQGFGLKSFELDNLGQDPELSVFRPVEMKQEHSARVLLIDRVPDQKPAVDALITSRPGLLLLVKTADCLPLFLVDTEHRVVAAVHGGWRGTAGRLVEITFDLMRKSFSSCPEKTLAALGPAIEAGCYEVGQEVYDSFSRQGFPPDRAFSPGQERGKYFLNLRAANRWLLTEAIGLPADNISSLDWCTFCQPELLSYRRKAAEKARLINFIGIKD